MNSLTFSGGPAGRGPRNRPATHTITKQQKPTRTPATRRRAPKKRSRNSNHPKIQEAIGKVVDAGKRHGKFLGRPAGSPEKVKEFIDQGFLFFQAPTEISFMTAGVRKYLEPLGKPGA